ncbi:HAD family hydrolase [Demequina aurantiaca]|uniref:HAD family hydrolase n=1 Tax=Demequina aurantiaca TaxID=676200 RepID=UPI003D34C695
MTTDFTDASPTDSTYPDARRADLPAAVLWDLDGTLIDSEPYWIAAETELALKFGVTWTHEDGLTLVGKPLPASAALLRGRGVDMDVTDIVDFLIARVAEQVRRHVPWQSDARLLLEQTLAAGIPCALVTMSYAVLAEAATQSVPDAFSVVVSGDEVTNGKPHPESYLLAAQRLGVDIEDCVAIEDSPSGIGAAYASGARTIAVKRLTPVEPLPGLTRVTSLDRLGIDGLRDVAAGTVIDELGSGV